MSWRSLKLDGMIYNAGELSLSSFYGVARGGVSSDEVATLQSDRERDLALYKAEVDKIKKKIEARGFYTPGEQADLAFWEAGLKAVGGA
jgi:hypothetical protein